MKDVAGMIVSVLTAAVTFLVLFLLLQWNLLVSALLCVGVYFGVLLLSKPVRKISGSREASLTEQEERDELLREAREDLRDLDRAAGAITDASVRADAEALHKTGMRILSYLEENPDKIRQARRFFTYYLDTAAKLLSRYIDFQETGLHTEEILEILNKTAKALPVLNHAFEKQFTHLMAGELLDVETDIALLEKTIKMEEGLQIKTGIKKEVGK